MKRLDWVGSSHKDFCAFPANVRQQAGYALYLAQNGDKHLSAKPLKGFNGADVLEIVNNNTGDTYRTVYTTRFTDTVYVLHAFKKKSKHGIKTSADDIGLIKARLKRAEQDNE